MSPTPWTWDGESLRDANGVRIAWAGYRKANGVSQKVDATEKDANMRLIVALVNGRPA